MRVAPSLPAPAPAPAPAPVSVLADERPIAADDPRLSEQSGLRVAVLAAVSAVALVCFALYAAYAAARAEDIIAAQPITVPGGAAAAAYGAGERAPDFALTGLDGQPARLADFAGRPVWINVWASWCAPCRAEMPDIDAVYREERSKAELAARTRGETLDPAAGLALLMVSIGERPEAVSRYFAATKYALPVFVDPTYAITERYRVNGLPTHYFIGRDGVIRDLAIGGLKPNGMRARLAKILSA